MFHTTTWEFTLYRRVAVTWAASSCTLVLLRANDAALGATYSQVSFSEADRHRKRRRLWIEGEPCVHWMASLPNLPRRWASDRRWDRCCVRCEGQGFFMRYLMGSKQQVICYTDVCRYRQRRKGGNRHSRHRKCLVCINIPFIHRREGYISFNSNNHEWEYNWKHCQQVSPIQSLINSMPVYFSDLSFGLMLYKNTEAYSV